MTASKNFYDLDELRKDVFQNKVSKAHIYNQVASGDIPSAKIGRRILVPAWWVNKLLVDPSET